MKSLNLLLLSIFTTALVSCGGGGTQPAPSVSAGGSPSNPVYGQYNSPDISYNAFVNALNAVDGEHSYLVLTPNMYSHTSLVIWDDKKNQYVAVSLSYLRTIVYYDYYSNDRAVALEFRNIQAAGNPNGGRAENGRIGYEVVDYSWDYDVQKQEWGDSYRGRLSGVLYEDQMETTDVSLMARDDEAGKFIQKAARVSMAFNVSIETSMSMVTLGSKIEHMISRGNGELTKEDQSALLSDMKRLTGVSLEEIAAVANDSIKREEVLGKIASKIGTSPKNLEQKLLPEILGITL